jgi:hypothetical protein
MDVEETDWMESEEDERMCDCRGLLGAKTFRKLDEQVADMCTVSVK